MKKHLQAHWEDIRAHLQRCHSFSEEAIIWQSSFEQGPGPECFSLLEELSSSSAEMCHESQALIQQSAIGMGFLSSVEPQISDLLRRHSNGAPATSTMFGNPEKISSNLGLETNAFLGIRSDGFAAIASTTTALAKIRDNLRMLCQFWTVASEFCRTLVKSNASITEEHAYHLGQTWKEWQEEILGANVSIAKSLDALAVEPVPPPSPVAATPRAEPPAPPTSRRQQRRRGSSKSDASIPSSPISLPRKMSGLDDDGVPKACWGFGGFSLKRK